MQKPNIKVLSKEQRDHQPSKRVKTISRNLCIRIGIARNGDEIIEACQNKQRQ